MPGVSMTMPPPGRTRSCRDVVVWRPLPSHSRTAVVRSVVSPSSALIRLDFPTPEDPMKAPVRAPSSNEAISPRPVPSWAEAARTLAPPETAEADRTNSSICGRRSALLITMAGSAPLSRVSSR